MQKARGAGGAGRTKESGEQTGRKPTKPTPPTRDRVMGSAGRPCRERLQYNGALMRSSDTFVIKQAGAHNLQA